MYLICDMMYSLFESMTYDSIFADMDCKRGDSLARILTILGPLEVDLFTRNESWKRIFVTLSFFLPKVLMQWKSLETL